MKINKIILFLAGFTFCGASEYFMYDARGVLLKKIESNDLKNDLSFLKTKTPILIQKKSNKQKVGSFSEYSIMFNMNRDSVWIESEKNEVLKLCFENSRIISIETALPSEILNNSCVSLRSPSNNTVAKLIINDHLNNTKYVNIAVGMKHFVFQNENVKLGFNGGGYSLKNKSFDDSENNRVYPDPEKLVKLNAEYLVDKYSITNCEFLQYMGNEMNLKDSFENEQKNNIVKMWNSRINRLNETKCETNDSAANVVYLYQALVYANQRSLAEDLEPYYIFEKTDAKQSLLYPDSSFTVVNSEKKELGDHWIKVSVNPKSNGYRLPYYDEWMFLARGGLTDGQAVWGDSSKNLSDALAYAWFGDSTSYKTHRSKPVGLLNPNGYELYDVFGLVNEFVLFPGKNPFESLHNTPSCLKGGDYRTRLHHSYNEIYIEPYWKWVNYGYSKINYGSSIGGFRLVRKLK